MASELAPAAAPVASSSLPVVFFDGDREIDIGSVPVHPLTGFKKFQAAVSQKIGIAPHQISTSLVRRKKARSSPEIRRKVPIDETSDFAAIARERDCFVLAVLRRSSRRERRTRTRRGHRHGDIIGDEDDKKKISAAAAFAPEKMLLRRNPAGVSGGLDPMLGGLMRESSVGLGLWDYESHLRNLERQRQRYLMSTAAVTAYFPDSSAEEDGGYLWFAPRRGVSALDIVSPPPRPSSNASPAVCEECEAAKEEARAPGFHWCVYDAITVGFRSPVGPIERPSKKHIDASA